MSSYVDWLNHPVVQKSPLYKKLSMLHNSGTSTPFSESLMMGWWVCARTSDSKEILFGLEVKSFEDFVRLFEDANAHQLANEVFLYPVPTHMGERIERQWTKDDIRSRTSVLHYAAGILDDSPFYRVMATLMEKNQKFVTELKSSYVANFEVPQKFWSEFRCHTALSEDWHVVCSEGSLKNLFFTDLFDTALQLASRTEGGVRIVCPAYEC